jgi:hypothetical protein
LNSEKIVKIWKTGKLNSDKIWKIWKKGKLNSEKIWKIWKKGKLNSEMIWKIWKISVVVIITTNETSSSSPFCPLPFHPPPPPSMHVYTLFFRIEQNHPGIVFARDYASRDQSYHFIHLTLRFFSRNTPVRTRT